MPENPVVLPPGGHGEIIPPPATDAGSYAKLTKAHTEAYERRKAADTDALNSTIRLCFLGGCMTALSLAILAASYWKMDVVKEISIPLGMLAGYFVGSKVSARSSKRKG